MKKKIILLAFSFIDVFGSGIKLKMDDNQDPGLTSRIRNSPVLDLSILQHSGNQETCARLYDLGESRARICKL
jgi:hypothetical protein